MMDLIELVKEHGKKVKLTKGMRIFQMGESPDYLYYLESGWIKIAQEAEDGQDITLSLHQSGDLFGLAEILANAPARACYASSLTDVVFYVISVEQLFIFLEQKPAFWQPLCQMVAERLIGTQNFVKALTNLPVPARIGWFLHHFAEEKDGQIVIEIPMTHEEISYLVGCSRQKVTSNLNAWRKAGYILYERGKIEILDEDAIFPLM